MMIFGNPNQQRIQQLEEQNRQWQLYYQTQMPPPQLIPPAPSKAKKKGKKKPQNKVNPDPLSMEVKMWIFIGIISFFAVIIVKNWITDATTTPPERVEKRKK
jgi:hypothetical protein